MTDLEEFLSLDGTRLATAHGNFYDTLCRTADLDEKASEKKKPFKFKADLFPVALIIGVLNDKRDDTKKEPGFVRFSSVSNHNRNIIKIFFYSVAKGEDWDEKWKDIKELADGGIQIIEDEYNTTQDFDVYKFFADVNKMWPDKSKQIIKNLQGLS